MADTKKLVLDSEALIDEANRHLKRLEAKTGVRMLGSAAEEIMLAEAEAIVCAEDWDSNNDKIRAIANLVRSYALNKRNSALERVARAIDQMEIEDTNETQWGFSEACRLIQARVHEVIDSALVSDTDAA